MKEDILRQASPAKAAILIVNGGDNAEANRWIRLCLDRIAAFTEYPNYHIYLWNNRSLDRELERWLLARPRLTLISGAVYERLNHPHRTPLQRLYHAARQENAHYIVTLDSDAHPLRSGWLTQLLHELDGGAALAGVWRDEMQDSTRPYLHPSCLGTTTAFLESRHLPLDFDPTHRPADHDTLAHLTWAAEAEGAPIYRLQRSNRRNFHYLMGGIYGDTIYHHGAGSRSKPIFHSDRITPGHDAQRIESNQQMSDGAADLLFSDYEQYLGWLRGEEVSPAVAERMEQVMQQGSQENLGSDPHPWQSSFRKRLKQIPVLSPIITRLRQHLRQPARTNKNDLQVFATPMLRSFTEEDLAALPRGWTASLPHFVGIGAPKSGTSWWYSLILDHPQVAPNRVTYRGPASTKELQFFVHLQHHANSAEQIALYRQAFAAPPGAVCGEFSTQYLSYPLCIESLACAAPEAKILVVLRNPVDRFISHQNHLTVVRLNRGFPNLNPQQRQIYETFPLYTEAALHSLYSIGLERLFRCFDRDRILILQYERMARFPLEELARTYRFLGVDDRYLPQKVTKTVNKVDYIIPQPSMSERANLAAYFAGDVRRVLTLCPELDAELWPEFTPFQTGQGAAGTEEHA